MTDRAHEIEREELADREAAELDAAEERADVMRDEAEHEMTEAEAVDLYEHAGWSKWSRPGAPPR